MNKNPDRSGLKPPMTSDTQPAKRGRKAGIPNKNNLIRQVVETTHPNGFHGFVVDLLQDIANIKDDAKRVDATIKILPYIAPQLKATDINISANERGSITIVYGQVMDEDEDK